jgi:hypothetical protein
MTLINTLLAARLRLLFLLPVIVLFGCAHPISIQPKQLDAVSRTSSTPTQLKEKVGYYIPDKALELEVTTPGGGGDAVRYFPYRDMQPGYERVLHNVFESVVRLSAMAGPAEMQASHLTYVLAPTVTTSSGSTGVFTWPPTNFSVDIATEIRDSSGKIVATPRVLGAASVGGIMDMGGNFGVTGQMAMQDALQKQQSLLFETIGTVTGKTIVPGTSASSPLNSSPLSPAEERLRALRDLRDKDLLTPEEYEKRRQEVIRSL